MTVERERRGERGGEEKDNDIVSQQSHLQPIFIFKP
jgi:hypothetical protein